MGNMGPADGYRLPAISSLCKVLRENSILTELSLASTNLHGPAAKELAKALPESRALAKLDLQGHSFSDSIKRELQAAQEQSRVRELLL